MINLLRLSLLSVVTAAALAFSAEPAAQAPWPLWDGQETIEQYAQRANLPPTMTLDLGNGVKLETVLIPAGEFTMGTPEPEKPIVGQAMVVISAGILLALVLAALLRARKKHTRPQFSLAMSLVLMLVGSVGVWGGVRWHEALKTRDAYENEYPAHLVTLTKPFYFGRYVVTWEQYQQVINNEKGGDSTTPARCLPWEDAQEFCKKASQNAGQPIRLPTEAEWEFACRAGTRTKYHSGDSEEDLQRVAWYAGDGDGGEHPVGQKEPNRFGLYDMHGYWQWCQDWNGAYEPEAQTDPQGPVNGSSHVVRGGLFSSSPRDCRSAYRGKNERGCEYVGFRVAVSVPPKQPGK